MEEESAEEDFDGKCVWNFITVVWSSSGTTFGRKTARVAERII
jgi:hypothetical protein